VRAKSEGRAPTAMDAATAALFPDEFQESELGEIPRGWRIGHYGAGLSVVKGKSYKSDELQPSQTALVTLKSFQRGGGYRDDGLKEYVGQYKPEQVVHPGEVVVAFTDVTQAAEVIGRPARVRPDGRYLALVASLDVGIVRPTAPELPPEYLYYCFLEQGFTDHTYAHANGSTVLHLAAGAVEKYEGVWPDRKVAAAFVDLVSPLLKRQDANWAECDTLGKLRDALLPKLLSGELRVRDAEKAVGHMV
jgi:type I restriction enzyme, S subunit